MWIWSLLVMIAADETWVPWNSVHDGVMPSTGGCGVMLNKSHIYMVGGRIGEDQVTNKIWEGILDQDAVTWSLIPFATGEHDRSFYTSFGEYSNEGAPEPRFGAMCTSRSHHEILFGLGSTGTDSLGDIWFFDINTSQFQWAYGNPLGVFDVDTIGFGPRQDFCADADDYDVFVYGGSPRENNVLGAQSRDLFRFNLQSKTMEKLPSIETAMGVVPDMQHCAVFRNLQEFILLPSYLVTEKAYVYNAEKRTWSSDSIVYNTFNDDPNVLDAIVRGASTWTQRIDAFSAKMFIYGGIDTTDHVRSVVIEFDLLRRQGRIVSDDAAALNTPTITNDIGASNSSIGSRHSATIFADSMGNAFLYGGIGFDATGTVQLQDMWSFRHCLTEEPFLQPECEAVSDSSPFTVSYVTEPAQLRQQVDPVDQPQQHPSYLWIGGSRQPHLSNYASTFGGITGCGAMINATTAVVFGGSQGSKISNKLIRITFGHEIEYTLLSGSIEDMTGSKGPIGEAAHVSIQHPSSRQQHVCFMDNDLGFHIYGGSKNLRPHLADHWVLDTHALQMTLLADPTALEATLDYPGMRAFSCTARGHDEVFLFGGFEQSDLYSYSFDSKQWTQLQEDDPKIMEGRNFGNRDCFFDPNLNTFVLLTGQVHAFTGTGWQSYHLDLSSSMRESTGLTIPKGTYGWTIGAERFVKVAGSPSVISYRLHGDSYVVRDHFPNNFVVYPWTELASEDATPNDSDAVPVLQTDTDVFFFAGRGRNAGMISSFDDTWLVGPYVSTTRSCSPYGLYQVVENQKRYCGDHTIEGLTDSVGHWAPLDASSPVTDPVCGVILDRVALVVESGGSVTMATLEVAVVKYATVTPLNAPTLSQAVCFMSSRFEAGVLDLDTGDLWTFDLRTEEFTKQGTTSFENGTGTTVISHAEGPEYVFLLMSSTEGSFLISVHKYSHESNRIDTHFEASTCFYDASLEAIVLMDGRTARYLDDQGVWMLLTDPHHRIVKAEASLSSTTWTLGSQHLMMDPSGSHVSVLDTELRVFETNVAGAILPSTEPTLLVSDGKHNTVALRGSEVWYFAPHQPDCKSTRLNPLAVAPTATSSLQHCPAASAWFPVPVAASDLIPESRSFACSVSMNATTILMQGGESDAGSYGDVWALYLGAEPRWVHVGGETNVPGAPHARSRHGCTALDNRLVLVGGVNGGDALSSIAEFDTVTRALTITHESTLEEATVRGTDVVSIGTRLHSCVARRGNELIVIGGQGSGNNPLFAYDGKVRLVHVHDDNVPMERAVCNYYDNVDMLVVAFFNTVSVYSFASQSWTHTPRQWRAVISDKLVPAARTAVSLGAYHDGTMMEVVVDPSSSEHTLLAATTYEEGWKTLLIDDRILDAPAGIETATYLGSVPTGDMVLIGNTIVMVSMCSTESYAPCDACSNEALHFNAAESTFESCYLDPIGAPAPVVPVDPVEDPTQAPVEEPTEEPEEAPEEAPEAPAGSSSENGGVITSPALLGVVGVGMVAVAVIGGSMWYQSRSKPSLRQKQRLLRSVKTGDMSMTMLHEDVEEVNSNPLHEMNADLDDAEEHTSDNKGERMSGSYKGIFDLSKF